MPLSQKMAIAAGTTAPAAPLAIPIPPAPVEPSEASKPPAPADLVAPSVPTIEVPPAPAADSPSKPEPVPATAGRSGSERAGAGGPVEALIVAPRVSTVAEPVEVAWSDLDHRQVRQDLSDVVEALTSAGPFTDPAAGVALLAIGLRSALPLPVAVALSFAGRTGERGAAWALSFLTTDPVADCGAVFTMRPATQGVLVEVGTATTAEAVLRLPILGLTPDRRRTAALDAACASGAPARLRVATAAYAEAQGAGREAGWIQARMERDGVAFAAEAMLWAQTFGDAEALSPGAAAVAGHLMAGLVWVRDLAAQVGLDAVVRRLDFAHGFADLARLACSGE